MIGRLAIGAWIAIGGTVWCLGCAILAMLGELMHWTLYIHLAAMVMNGEALRYNIIVRKRWRL